MNPTSINFSEFENKKILITGGSTGIGAELAKAFAKQGAIVGLHYFSSEDAANQVAAEIRSEGGRVELVRADVSNAQALAAAVKEAAARLGGLNGIINNAGGMVRRVSYADVTDKDYDEIMDLNARSIVVASKEALPFLKKDGGFVINTTSIAARNGAICYLDEVVEARQDTTVVIHSITDDRRVLPIEKKGELLKADDDFHLVVSYNPGYQSVVKDLKESTKQRFCALDFEYPANEV